MLCVGVLDLDIAGWWRTSPCEKTSFGCLRHRWVIAALQSSCLRTMLLTGPPALLGLAQALAEEAQRRWVKIDEGSCVVDDTTVLLVRLV